MSDLLNDLVIVPVSKFNAVTMLQYDELPLPKGNRSTRKKDRYLNCICAFDIETTRLAAIDQSVMYIWQFCINAELIVVGRTWGEYLQMLRRIKEVLNGLNLVIYVHNLSYEFTFLKGVYDFLPEDIFAIDTRKIAKCRMMDCFEYRCSYIHSNMNLYTFTSKYHAKHIKLKDTYDYAKIRYPWTPLSEEELAYCVYDVQGLVEALINEMSHDGDTLYTVPLTSTGYVRRDAKEAMKNVSYTWLHSIIPDYDTYQLLNKAFRGGNTHANRYYVRKVVKNVKCYDRSSSYPDVQMNCLFPITPWKIHPHCTLQDLRELSSKGYAYVVKIHMDNVALLDDRNGCPYLPIAKCEHVHGEQLDNGRIISADYLEHVCTDIDLEIILQQYRYNTLYISDCRYSHYGRLSGSMRACISEYYTLKTELKGDKTKDILYTKSKNKLNSLYGMSAQQMIRDAVVYDETTRTLTEKELEDPEIEFQKQSRRAFFSYAWGVWTTAWARKRLQEAIDIVGFEDFIYCDTDSVYFIGNHDFTEYNLQRMIDSRQTGAVATDSKGNSHYMGVFEEDHFCREFKTLGAKKYCWIDETGKMTLTVAGVVKEYKDETGEIHSATEELGSIDNFAEGFTFIKAGGLEAVYNDGICQVVNVDGHDLVITDNVCLKPSTYTLGITAEYERLLNGLDMLGVDIVE